MNKLGRTLAVSLMALSPEIASAQSCEVNQIQNPVDNCQSCHQAERTGLDSPAVKESVRIGQSVIEALGNDRYLFYHDHARQCGRFVDVINIVPRYHGDEAEAAIISSAQGGGKDLLLTESYQGIVQQLRHWLIKNGEPISQEPDIKFQPPSQYYQRAVNNSRRLQ